MCFVSYVSDYGRQRVPDNLWNRDNFEDFKKLLEDARKLDQKTNQPDCEDLEKSSWMKEVEERLKKLEGK